MDQGFPIKHPFFVLQRFRPCSPPSYMSWHGTSGRCVPSAAFPARKMWKKRAIAPIRPKLWENKTNQTEEFFGDVSPKIYEMGLPTRKALDLAMGHVGTRSTKLLNDFTHGQNWAKESMFLEISEFDIYIFWGGAPCGSRTSKRKAQTQRSNILILIGFNPKIKLCFIVLGINVI